MLDTIIIGAGPSGLSCALNLRRDNKEVLLIEKEGIGRQIAKSPKVENIPGTKSISGLEFVDNLTAQVMDLGANFEFDEVISITKENNIFKVNPVKSIPPIITPITGIIISPTNDVTILPNAPPIMTPTAKSITLPFAINFLNSFNIFISPFIFY